MHYDKVERDTYRQELLQQGICPECYYDLDIGYECNQCGYDGVNELRSNSTQFTTGLVIDRTDQ